MEPSQKDLAEYFGINVKTLHRWRTNIEGIEGLRRYRALLSSYYALIKEDEALTISFIPQTKATDYNKVSAANIEESYYASKKYNGHYVQIHKINGIVKFYTSSGIEFYIKNYADTLLSISHDFIMETEYIGDTKGAMGDREACTLDTFRAEFKNGVESNTQGTFKVFDILYFNKDIKEMEFKNRVKLLNKLKKLDIVEHTLMTIDQAKELNNKLYANGDEGVMLNSPTHTHNGTQTTKAIKLKNRPTSDLKCIDVEIRHNECIKILVLEDEDGIIARVPNIQHHYRADDFINKVVEISYERRGESYIQPVFVGIRYDKS